MKIKNTQNINEYNSEEDKNEDDNILQLEIYDPDDQPILAKSNTAFIFWFSVGCYILFHNLAIPLRLPMYYFITNRHEYLELFILLLPFYVIAFILGICIYWKSKNWVFYIPIMLVGMVIVAALFTIFGDKISEVRSAI